MNTLLLRVLLPLAALFGLVWGAYALGSAAGAAACRSAATTATAVATVKSEMQAASTAQKAIARATQTGDGRERDRVAIDTTFAHLTEEAAHEPPARVDDACVLPADRLRIWAAANAGDSAPDPGAPAREPDSPAPHPASAGFRPPTRPGDEPSAGGPGLPPARQPDVPPAGFSGSAP